MKSRDEKFQWESLDEKCPLAEKENHHCVMVLKHNDPKELPRPDICPVCRGRGTLRIVVED